jgi:hypothetical protein
MKLTLTALTALAIASSSFSFMPSKADGTVVTMGDYTCDLWSEYRNGGANLRMATNSYLFGLMDGLAVGTENDFWANLTTKQVLFWMDKHCDNNPLDSVLYGSYKLMEERHGPDWYK